MPLISTVIIHAIIVGVVVAGIITTCHLADIHPVNRDAISVGAVFAGELYYWSNRLKENRFESAANDNNDNPPGQTTHNPSGPGAQRPTADSTPCSGASTVPRVKPNTTSENPVLSEGDRECDPTPDGCAPETPFIPNRDS